MLIKTPDSWKRNGWEGEDEYKWFNDQLKVC